MYLNQISFINIILSRIIHLFVIRERQMDLILGLESNNSIAWSGISDKAIGSLKPGDSINIPLSLIPLESGLIVSTL